jgi:hypothetical protein
MLGPQALPIPKASAQFEPHIKQKASRQAPPRLAMTSAGVIALSPFQPTILPQSLLRESANVSALSCRYDVKVTLIRHFNEYECLICGKPKNYGGMLMNTPPKVRGKFCVRSLN